MATYGRYGRSNRDDEDDEDDEDDDIEDENLWSVPFSQVKEDRSTGSGRGAFRWGRLLCSMATPAWGSRC